MARWHEGAWAPIPDVLSPADRAGGTFRAYEPDPLLDRPLSLNDETLFEEAVQIEQLARELGDTAAGHERFLLGVEAIASSRLRRLMISSYDVVLAELAHEEPRVDVDDPVTRAVACHIPAWRAAAEELPADTQGTVAGIDHVQRLLLADQPDRLGVREDQNRVGGEGPGRRQVRAASAGVRARAPRRPRGVPEHR